jgi:hypothetical protein
MKWAAGIVWYYGDGAEMMGGEITPDVICNPILTIHIGRIDV